MGLGTFFGLAMVGGLFLAAAAIGWFILKVILAVILLPFRLLLWLVALPLLLVKAVVLTIVGVLAGLLFAIGLVACGARSRRPHRATSADRPRRAADRC